MGKTLFQYPGGKSRLVPWILESMPDHECFVEGFGGSGALMLNKPSSEVDVFNDLDSEIIHFFTVYREAPDRLADWLEGVPFSRKLYEEWGEAFYNWNNDDYDGWDPGEPLVGGPDDPATGKVIGPDDIEDRHIKRAGIFFTLRYTQWGSKYHDKSGFAISKVQNGAATFNNAKDRLRELAGCFDNVVLECTSYEHLIETYDGEDTCWYFDPPYIGTEEYYRESDFDHDHFCDVLENEIEGYWIVSYDTIPDRLEKFNIKRKESTNFINSGKKGEGTDTVETLVMNFDDGKTRGFTSAGQSSIYQSTRVNGDEDKGVEEDNEEQVTLWDEDDEEEDGGDKEGWLDNV